ncbi:cell wall hydrolase [Ammoniphilus sp. YIM 78166]|uniref:cell wall hydrolase n=1 Tax=Ammoniphilus sp. YIM 78166 TaxID=1644106 RepID=UPI00106F9460|nr:cell wall hydrolase [Ammoniphilus sp. YIM 78166]
MKKMIAMLTTFLSFAGTMGADGSSPEVVEEPCAVQILDVQPKELEPEIQQPEPSYSEQDLVWLARIIHAEAKGEPFKGKVAVGAVVLNRVEDGEFPKSIYQVIHHKIKGKYQFQPVANGRIHNQPDESSKEAAKQALEGTDPTNGALFFYNPKIARSKWIATLPQKAVIGNHVFAGS